MDASQEGFHREIPVLYGVFPDHRRLRTGRGRLDLESFLSEIAQPTQRCMHNLLGLHRLLTAVLHVLEQRALS